MKSREVKRDYYQLIATLSALTMIICVCFNQRYKELLNLLRLCTHSVAINTLEVSIIVSDLIFLGHKGKGDFAGAVCGYILYHLVWYFIEGILSAQDTLCSAG